MSTTQICECLRCYKVFDAVWTEHTECPNCGLGFTLPMARELIDQAPRMRELLEIVREQMNADGPFKCLAERIDRVLTACKPKSDAEEPQ